MIENKILNMKSPHGLAWGSGGDSKRERAGETQSLWRVNLRREKFPRDKVGSDFYQKTEKWAGGQEPGARRDGAVEIQEESQYL